MLIGITIINNKDAISTILSFAISYNSYQLACNQSLAGPPSLVKHNLKGIQYGPSYYV